MWNPREAEHDFLATKYAAFLILFFVSTAFAGCTASDGLRYACLSVSATQFNGEVVKIERQRGSRALVTYSFRDASATERVESRFFESYEKQDFKQGQVVSVLACPLVPSLFDLEEAVAFLEVTFYLFAGAVVVLLLTGSAIVWAFYQLLRHHAEDRYY